MHLSLHFSGLNSNSCCHAQRTDCIVSIVGEPLGGTALSAPETRRHWGVSGWQEEEIVWLASESENPMRQAQQVCGSPELSPTRRMSCSW